MRFQACGRSTADRSTVCGSSRRFFSTAAMWCSISLAAARGFSRVCRLVHQRDQRRAAEQVDQQLRQHLVAQHACQNGMKVCQQPRAAGHVGARHRRRFITQVAAQLGNLAVGDARTELAGQCGFEHRTHLEHLARLVDAGHRDKGATRAFQRHQTITTELVQRLAHQRARDLEDVGQLLLRQLGAGHQAALDDGQGDRVDDAFGRADGLRPGRAGRSHDLERVAGSGHGVDGMRWGVSGLDVAHFSVYTLSDISSTSSS